MVYVLGEPAHGAKAWRDVDVGHGRQRTVRFTRQPRHPGAARARPTRVAAHRHSRGREDLIVAHHDRHVVRTVLAIQLTGRYQRVRLPFAAVVDGDLGVPLSKVIRAAAPALTARHRRWPRVPLEAGTHRIARRERHGKTEMRHRTVGCARIIYDDRGTVDRRRSREALIAVVRVAQILKANAVLTLVRFAPLGVRTKRVQVLVDVHLAQRVGRVVHVDERGARV